MVGGLLGAVVNVLGIILPGGADTSGPVVSPAILQQTLGVSYLFIGHDLATVAHISDRIAVMYLGQIVELADSLELCAKPLHPYTQALFSAALPSHPDERHERLTITGEFPSALDPPSGCRFHPRYPHAMSQCANEAPVPKEVAPHHTVACDLY